MTPAAQLARVVTVRRLRLDRAHRDVAAARQVHDDADRDAAQTDAAALVAGYLRTQFRVHATTLPPAQFIAAIALGARTCRSAAAVADHRAADARIALEVAAQDLDRARPVYPTAQRRFETLSACATDAADRERRARDDLVDDDLTDLIRGGHPHG